MEPNQQPLQTQETPPQVPNPTPQVKKSFNKLIFVIVLLVVLLLTSLGAFYVVQMQNNSSLQNSTAVQPINTPLPTIDPTANWKTYSNSEYGFSFKYPEELQLGNPTNTPNIIKLIKSEENPDYNFILIQPEKSDLSSKTDQDNYYKNKYLPLGSDYKGQVSLDSKQVYFYLGDTSNPIVKTYRGHNVTGKIVKTYIVPLNEPNNYLKIDYVSDNETAILFDQIISTFEFTKPLDTSNWKTYENNNLLFSYPPEWNPSENKDKGYQGNRLNSIFLGIPMIDSARHIGFSAVPYENFKMSLPSNPTIISISEQPGVKWINKGNNYISYNYATSYKNDGTFTIEVTIPKENSTIEKQLDHLIRTIQLK